ncbi:hypothetical protein C8F04DRAFT_1088138 [Mycena alexandri]|uniref:Ubiquitin 3 binding protein But2 C-terminal domain-containing protein n=1 Tax=Mycena alexandri TaxID=1745969 RepID=A0AAD6T533_9AGAR|nr:hypothetical protein C8F04DRAFT_1088138 [Mycena alexandri]
MATYTPLPSCPHASDVQDDGWGSPAPKREATRLEPSFSSSLRRIAEIADRTVCFVFVACLVSLASLAMNITRTFSPPLSSAPSPTKLHYPNPYIGLEHAVLTDVSPPAPIVNFPLVLAQTNSSNPKSVSLQQPHSLTTFGMIYPQEREFLVDEEVSTIAQFRILDFRMERCIAVLEIPSSADVHDFPNKTVALSDDSLHLQIWLLDAADDIDPHTLCWVTRPRRTSLLSTMAVRPGHNLLESPTFTCPARSLVTLEISCSTPRCHLQFRQDKKSPRLAFFLRQHSNEGSLKRD